MGVNEEVFVEVFIVFVALISYLVIVVFPLYFASKKMKSNENKQLPTRPSFIEKEFEKQKRVITDVSEDNLVQLNTGEPEHIITPAKGSPQQLNAVINPYFVLFTKHREALKKIRDGRCSCVECYEKKCIAEKALEEKE